MPQHHLNDPTAEVRSAQLPAETPRIVTPDTTDEIAGTTPKIRTELEARGDFPTRVPVSKRRYGYMLREIIEWIEARAEQREDLLKTRISPNPLAKKNRQQLAKATTTSK